MRRVYTVLVLAVALLAVACIDNEESFFIEHATTLPEPPDCTFSSGDPVSNYFWVDVAQADFIATAFYTSNAVAVRNDYDNLKAESNGIIVDGYELYTVIPGEGIIGGTEYFEMNDYIEPESSDILIAEILSKESSNALRSAFNCTQIDSSSLMAYSAALVHNATYGTPIGVQPPTGDSTVPERLYSVVRFLGHTQGGKDVQTQEFSMNIFAYCGPQGGWESCAASPCLAHCKGDATRLETCFQGAYAPPSCADYLSMFEWTVTYIDPNSGEETTGNFCSEICGY